MIVETIKTVTETIKGLSTEFYSDALKPSMIEVGKALQTVSGLGNSILTPFALLNDNAKFVREKYLAKLDLKLKEVGNSDIIEIVPEIAVPVLKRLEYTQNEHLVDMFLNLLQTAADQKKVHKAHPSFNNIITNLSPDEARILKYLHTTDQICHLNIKIEYNDKTFSSHFLRTTILEFGDIIEIRENAKIYISSLMALGIIKEYACPSENSQIDLLYKYLEPEQQKLTQSVENVKNIIYQKGAFGLTEIGSLFTDCCIK